MLQINLLAFVDDTYLRKQGFYRRFLDDPQRIGNKVVFNFDPDE